MNNEELNQDHKVNRHHDREKSAMHWKLVMFLAPVLMLGLERKKMWLATGATPPSEHPGCFAER